MGTRALIRVYDNDGKLLLRIYNQYDGYPTGLGADLKKHLGKVRLVNGLGMGDDESAVANGMDCFAAQVVASLKKGPGGVYIYPPSDTDDSWADFIYDFCQNKNGLPAPGATPNEDEHYVTLKVTKNVGTPRAIYEGRFSDFDPEEAEETAYNSK